MDFLINMTVTFSVTAILILILKRVFKNQFTPKWHVLIWTILIIRFVIPVLPESDISIYNFLPDISGTYAEFAEQKSAEQIYSIPEKTHSTLQKSPDNYLNSKNGINKEVTNENIQLEDNEYNHKPLEKMILLIYGAGVNVMAAVLLISYRRILKKVKTLPVCQDEEICHILDLCREQLKVKGDRIVLRKGVESPILAGILNPVICISEKYDCYELKHVFTHELCHYKNGDNIWNLISLMILCFNWFNPLAWYSFKTFRCDLEMYCDYRVINFTGAKKAYAEMLLNTVTGKTSFIISSICLESGEKEVSRRIKRIACFKKPKIWASVLGLVLLGVLSVLCLTNAPGFSQKTQLIDVCGPDNEWSKYMLEVPLSWGKEYEEVMPESPPYSENIIFHNKNGTETAALTYRMLDLSENEVEPEGSGSKGNLSGRVNYEKKVKELVKQSGILPVLKNNVKIQRIKEHSPYIWDAYKVTYLKDDKRIRTEVYIASDQYTRIMPVLYTENDSITDKELISTAMTLESVKAPASYRAKSDAGILTDAKRGVAVAGGDYDAEAMLSQYLENYVTTKLPLSKSIKGFKINSFKEINPVGDMPGILDNDMVQGETVPWNIIYPSARVYKVDYELEPTDKQKYKDIAGGGSEITEKGNKHYTERYAVFYGYSIDAKKYQAAFLGFLEDGSLAEWGVDYSVLNLINLYYEKELLPHILKNARVRYVGDASADGKLVRMLPLHEYGNGIELQTQKEPYGITVNYLIGRSEPYNPETGAP
ncbi:M56 family metallopeptidase [Aminipila terrae]|uniref:DUF4825 domain-containing protein n=1 Tax=Aminipila terrae TaxID=2697030 RepID=A0A6P1MMV5_9FIRM|nr:M56 family metallopeptidase [Aminipila terrae]QHI72996.1 DUF4825 domain-containing protein [Aminipila terrae]